VCLVWNQLNNKQIESIKQGKISFALKLKRQQATGLKGDIVLYKSYSEGKFIIKEAEQNSYVYGICMVNKGKLKEDWKTSQTFCLRIGATETV